MDLIKLKNGLIKKLKNMNKFKLDTIKFIFKHLDSKIIIFFSKKVRTRSYKSNTGTYIDEEIKFKKEETLGES